MVGCVPNSVDIAKKRERGMRMKRERDNVGIGGRLKHRGEERSEERSEEGETSGGKRGVEPRGWDREGQ